MNPKISARQTVHDVLGVASTLQALGAASVLNQKQGVSNIPSIASQRAVCLEYDTMRHAISPFPAARETPKPQPMSADLDAVFAALSDPTRRAILTMLLEDDMAVTDVADPFDISLAAISKHLTILTKAGLISQEKRGRVKWCKLEPDAMRAATVWIQGFGLFEPVHLDAFERFLQAQDITPTDDA